MEVYGSTKAVIMPLHLGSSDQCVPDDTYSNKLAIQNIVVGLSNNDDEIKLSGFVIWYNQFIYRKVVTEISGILVPEVSKNYYSLLSLYFYSHHELYLSDSLFKNYYLTGAPLIIAQNVSWFKK